jgi:hypothetical protein
MSQSLTDRYDDQIGGMLSCYDRVVITGTLPTICYAAGYAAGIRIFDYPAFAQTLRDQPCRNLRAKSADLETSEFQYVAADVRDNILI